MSKRKPDTIFPKKKLKKKKKPDRLKLNSDITRQELLE